MLYWDTQLRIDNGISLELGTILLGATVSLTQANPNYKAGDGTSRNYRVGLYTTDLFNNGLYIDTLLKYNNIHNQFNVKETASSSVKGKRRTQSIARSAELGQRFWLTSNKVGVFRATSTNYCRYSK